MELFGKFVIDNKNCVYKFNVNRVINWRVEYGILRIVGDHVEGKSNEDVDAISFSNFKIYQIPKNISQFFPNLKTLTMNSCSVKSISKHDLMGLKHLQQLNLTGNLLTNLPNNLFETTPNLESVSFYSNRIELIGPNIFDSMKHLKYVNLKMNTNIDECCKFNSVTTLDDLKKIIREECQPRLNDEIDDLFDFEDMKLFTDSFLEEYSFSFKDFDSEC